MAKSKADKKDEAVFLELDVGKDKLLQSRRRDYIRRDRELRKTWNDVINRTMPEVPPFKFGDDDYILDEAKRICGVDYIEELIEKDDVMENEWDEIVADMKVRLAYPVDFEHERFRGLVFKELTRSDIRSKMRSVSELNIIRKSLGMGRIRMFDVLAVAHDRLRHPEHGKACGCNDQRYRVIFDQHLHKLNAVEVSKTGELSDIDALESEHLKVIDADDPVEGMKAHLRGEGEESTIDDFIDVMVGATEEAQVKRRHAHGGIWD